MSDAKQRDRERERVLDHQRRYARKKLWEIAQFNTDVRTILERWMHGEIESFEDALCRIVDRLAEQNRELVEQKVRDALAAPIRLRIVPDSE